MRALGGDSDSAGWTGGRGSKLDAAGLLKTFVLD